MTRKLSILSVLITALAIALIAWFGFSWLEVISKNLEPNPTYSAYNLFVLLTRGA